MNRIKKEIIKRGFATTFDEIRDDKFLYHTYLFIERDCFILTLERYDPDEEYTDIRTLHFLPNFHKYAEGHQIITDREWEEMRDD